MRVVLVDDERIAIEHIKHLIPWERHGFEIAAAATNGKSALRLCEELRPQIMMIDIRMPAMDGLELIRAINEKDLGAKCIVMSAYEDFHYARQAISLGNVISYLVKHEVDPDKLLRELNKARAAWEADERQRRRERNERLKEIVMDADRRNDWPERTRRPELPDRNYRPDRTDLLPVGMKPPFALVLIQRDTPFSPIPPTAAGPAIAAPWNGEDMKLYCEHRAEWLLLGEFPVDVSQYAAVFTPKNKAAAFMGDTFWSLLSGIQSHLRQKHANTYSIFYTLHVDEASSLASAFRRVIAAAGYSVFFGREAVVCADDILAAIPEPNSFSSRTGRFEALIESLDGKRRDEIENSIIRLFDSVLQPCWDIRGLYELVSALTGLLNERRTMKGMTAVDPLDKNECCPAYHVDEIRERFVDLYCGLCAGDHVPDRLSSKLLHALRFIHEHFDEEIGIEDAAFATGISASYLHQLFKRELGRTFLDYLTETRIHQAKKILRREHIKMTEVAARVGYRSPQHFSQVFKRMTGVLPHQYRDGAFPS
ncbi:response regulator transcription factor [Paenibacillus alkalitolerans]|uniref:response regulator transcription factor n=1 Tax=Paenibacillus alkalitolerans TaxID=2799335 RepID=UPI0018F570E9|nr:helix-turn-helix domain-containing protein [Paenibacillus alkalitolerans]